jgi:hypothetical protein
MRSSSSASMVAVRGRWTSRLEPEGPLRDTVGVFRVGQSYWDGQRLGSLGYGAWSYRALDGFDLIVGESTTFEYIRYDTLGRPMQIVRRAYSPVTVTEADHAQYLTDLYGPLDGQPVAPGAPPITLEDLLSRYHWAGTRPAFSDLLVDAVGNVWVEEYPLRRFGREIPADAPSKRWSVFTRDGEWLGSVEVPGPFMLEAVYDDIVFGVWQDPLGVGSVRAYALIKPPA